MFAECNFWVELHTKVYWVVVDYQIFIAIFDLGFVVFVFNGEDASVGLFCVNCYIP